MNVALTKRQKIVTSAILLALGLLLIQSINFFILRYRLVLGLSILTLFLSFWALWEGLTRVKAVILLILPTLFTLGVSSFYFLLPIRWLTRIPVAILFCLSFYFLLLSQNIFSVAADRTIPLYRAASTVNFLFTLITVFFLNIVIFALDQSFYINGVVVAIVSFPLILQTLWSVQMEKVSSIILVYTAILSLIMGEGALALSFWPVAPTIWALLLAALLYVLMGVTTEFFRDRLNRRVVFEYLGIGTVVLIFATVVTSWVG